MARPKGRQEPRMTVSIRVSVLEKQRIEQKAKEQGKKISAMQHTPATAAFYEVSYRDNMEKLSILKEKKKKLYQELKIVDVITAEVLNKSLVRLEFMAAVNTPTGTSYVNDYLSIKEKERSVEFFKNPVVSFLEYAKSRELEKQAPIVERGAGKDKEALQRRSTKEEGRATNEGRNRIRAKWKKTGRS